MKRAEKGKGWMKQQPNRKLQQHENLFDTVYQNRSVKDSRGMCQSWYSIAADLAAQYK